MCGEVPLGRTQLAETLESAKKMPRTERSVLRWGSRINEDLQGETVLVVDDVYHTGETMAGVAAAAKNRGAKTVLGLAAARTLSV
ncbi:hypothetical protein GCM10017786_44420 [Amycolatopsis deserti]|uniref:Phosphoribosyltransferase domain-containing protein n=2 Tax=Amycolatopsis deserti TaxID=185696 RepID=A0ABQ3J8P2_9PSEU|nr:hypothetical protein GCM10017786_44420 [Amycolatopsis deserti]